MTDHKHATPVAEEPKVKQGNKADAEKPKTTVDGPAVPKAEKPKAEPKIASIRKYRILDGVDAGAFRGQRNLVVKALQKLAATAEQGAMFTLDEIVANVEGLVSKTPVSDSVKYHLGGLVSDKQATSLDVPLMPIDNKAVAA